MMEQQINICKGEIILKRAEDINEEVETLIEKDKKRKEQENEQKLKAKIKDLSDLLEKAKYDRRKYAVDYENILFAYPETKSYLEALGYIIVYSERSDKYYIAFDEATAKSLESQNKSYLRKKLILKIMVIGMWSMFIWNMSIHQKDEALGWIAVALISNLLYLLF